VSDEEHLAATLELAGAERVDDVRELWLELHHHHRQVVPSVALVGDDELSWQRRRALYLTQLQTGEGFLVLASIGREVAGYAAVFIERGPDDTFAIGDSCAELYSLSVAPSARGRGIGSQLLDRVDDELAARGVRDLRIAVMVGNEGAQRLYERRGLRPGEIVLYRLAARAH
jgi:ribosomal protein S18 acetylase RimI-like enzyme